MWNDASRCETSPGVTVKARQDKMRQGKAINKEKVLGRDTKRRDKKVDKGQKRTRCPEAQGARQNETKEDKTITQDDDHTRKIETFFVPANLAK